MNKEIDTKKAEYQLKEIEEKINKLEKDMKSSSSFTSKNSPRGIIKNLSRAYSILFEFIGLVTIFSVFGWYLDHHLESTPIFTIILFICGNIGAITNIIRNERRNNKVNKQRNYLQK